jgi:hypothetical protein
VGLPDEKSAKATVSGAVPDVGKPEKAAEGNPDPPEVTVIYPVRVSVLLPDALVTVSETS